MKFDEKQLNALKILLREDGVESTDDAVSEAAYWLLARAKSVVRPIPPEKQGTMERIGKKTQMARSTNVEH